MLILSTLASILPTLVAIVIVLATIHRVRALYRTAKRHTTPTPVTPTTTPTPTTTYSSRDDAIAAAYLRSIGQ